jgi:hypothetical protein
MFNLRCSEKTGKRAAAAALCTIGFAGGDR